MPATQFNRNLYLVCKKCGGMTENDDEKVVCRWCAKRNVLTELDSSHIFTSEQERKKIQNSEKARRYRKRQKEKKTEKKKLVHRKPVSSRGMVTITTEEKQDVYIKEEDGIYTYPFTNSKGESSSLGDEFSLHAEKQGQDCDPDFDLGLDAVCYCGTCMQCTKVRKYVCICTDKGT